MSRLPVRTIIETWKACGDRPPYRQALGGSREIALGVRTRWRGVQRRSTAPKRPKRVLWGEAAVRVRGWREATGFCREELEVLAQAEGLEISASTIHRYLRRAGLVRPSTKRRRPRFQNGHVMRPRNCPGAGYLQMDVKHVTPELSGLPDTCYLYAAMDISTRYKVGLILPKLDEGGALLALYHATQQFPFPLHYVQTDNGLEFQRRFHTKCTELGLEHFSIHKSAPNENAVVERSFRADEEEFFFWLEEAPQDHLELNAWDQRFLDTYNSVRPHMGINMLTPKETIALYHKS